VKVGDDLGFTPGTLYGPSHNEPRLGTDTLEGCVAGNGRNYAKHVVFNLIFIPHTLTKGGWNHCFSRHPHSRAADENRHKS